MRLVRNVSAAAIAVALASPAFAASETKVSKSVEVDGTIADVWAKIGKFCAIQEWHPAVAKCEDSKEGEVTRRVLTLKDGGVIKEKLTAQGESTYSYMIEESPLPVIGYNAVFSVKPDDDDKDEVNVVWTATFMPKGKEADAKKVIEGIFDGGLANIDTMLDK